MIEKPPIMNMNPNIKKKIPPFEGDAFEFLFWSISQMVDTANGIIIMIVIILNAVPPHIEYTTDFEKLPDPVLLNV